MPGDEQIIFTVDVDTSGVRGAISEATHVIENETQRWDNASEQSSSGMADAFSGALKKITAAFSAAAIGKAILNIGKESLQAASDLEEVQNVVDVTFGSAGASKIQDWANKAGKQFGLTETQAKKFTSTLGAMMKSSGLAGDQVLTMSTDLSGLAADMASFYNLDFDTAFDKIRAGISGETEPLKQLGINMSVANLNAFALEKRLDKTFEEMSQGEQIALRYEYIMSATADAQGDFSRTSTGYANSLRLFETNIESIKTKLGSTFIDVVGGAVNALNELLGELAAPEEKTFIDRLAEINIDKETKLAEIQAIKTEADVLVDVLDGLTAPSSVKSELEDIASGANSLNSESPSVWSSLLESLKSIDGLENIFSDNSNAGTNIETLAGALSGSSVDTSKAEAWKTFLGALSENAEAVSALTGKSVEETKAWLSGLSEEAGKLDANDANGWDALFATLIEGIPGIQSIIGVDTGIGGELQSISSGANALDSSSESNWSGLLSTLEKMDGLENLFGEDSQAANNIANLASALSGNSMTTGKAEAWNTFLSALSSNAEAVSELTGMSVEDTQEWLSGLADAANELDPESAEGWNTLFGALIDGLSGGNGNTEGGKKLLEDMAQYYLSMGSGSEVAEAGLRALGYSTEEIEQKQATWLAICKELVKTIPGLSSIINTETGEVKGGIPAIRAYADEWQRVAEYKAMAEAVEAERELYAEANNPAHYYAESEKARGKAKAALLNAGYSEDEIDEHLGKMYEYVSAMYKAGISLANAKKGFFDWENPLGMDLSHISGYDEIPIWALGYEPSDFEWYNKLNGEDAGGAEYQVLAYVDALYTEIMAANESVIVLEELDKSVEGLAQKEAEVGAEAVAAAKDMSVLSRAASGDADAMNTVTTAVNNAKDALTELDNYVSESYNSVKQSVENTFKGFDVVTSTSMQAKKKVSELSKQLAALGERTEDNAAEWDKLNNQINEYNSQTISVFGMKEGLESQLAFMDQYIENMEKAKQMGFSPELLAYLADGSIESAEYLDALVNSGYTGIGAEIDQLFSEVSEKKSTLAGVLNEQKLTVDEIYKEMAAKAAEAVAALNLEEDAAEASGKTIYGVAEGISSQVPAVASAVDSVLEELDRLEWFGISIDFGSFGEINFMVNDFLDGEHETGLDYVPFDGYLAGLHEGEGILTAEENRVWQRFKNGQPSSGVDYDTLGGVMHDNIHAGGNVYLNGRAVGQVISDQQGQSYRNLQRSGWQG